MLQFFLNLENLLRSAWQSVFKRYVKISFFALSLQRNILASIVAMYASDSESVTFVEILNERNHYAWKLIFLFQEIQKSIICHIIKNQKPMLFPIEAYFLLGGNIQEYWQLDYCSIGKKCHRQRGETKRRFISSGQGLFILCVRRPASICPTGIF